MDFHMSETSWFEQKTTTVGFVAGFLGGVTLGWIFSSSVFVNNSVKVVSNSIEYSKNESEEQKTFDPGSSDAEGDYKMVLIVRNDVDLGKGKIAAQCSHATLACFQKACEKIPVIVDEWFLGGQAKVICKCETDEDMELLRRKAKYQGLTTCLIRDAGRMKLGLSSKTVLGIGPAPSKLVNDIIRNLALY